MSAVVLQFPEKVQRQAKRRMSRVELDGRHRWMIKHRMEWQTEATDGAEYQTNPNVVRLKAIIRKQMGLSELSMERMRRGIVEGRKLIEKRNRVKAWLASLGADLDAITTAEQALFFAFDRLHACDLPSSA